MATFGGGLWLDCRQFCMHKCFASSPSRNHAIRSTILAWFKHDPSMIQKYDPKSTRNQSRSDCHCICHCLGKFHSRHIMIGKISRTISWQVHCDPPTPSGVPPEHRQMWPNVAYDSWFLWVNCGFWGTHFQPHSVNQPGESSLSAGRACDWNFV